MIYRRNPRHRRVAVAAVEFAFLLPLMVILILGVWEIGRLIQVSQLIANAAREGARQGASAKYTNAQIRQATFDYLKSSGVLVHPTLPNADVDLSNTNVVIEVDNLDGDESFEAEQFDRILVRVTIPMSNFQWLTSNTFMPANTRLTADATFLCMRDLPIVVPTTIPQRPFQ
jgi:Flp pilus assembly protein TadG